MDQSECKTYCELMQILLHNAEVNPTVWGFCKIVIQPVFYVTSFYYKAVTDQQYY